MLNINKNLSHYSLPIFLVFILALSRLIPHPPNFTPIIAVAMMSGYFFKDKYFSFFILFISMLLSDLFLGFYKGMSIIYLSLFIITYFFFILSSKINGKNLFYFSFLASLLFYLITNFSVWYLGDLYEKSLKGLIYCYYMAIPYFSKTFFSTLFFSYAAFFLNFFFKKKVLN
jgi:hypothetical protein